MVETIIAAGIITLLLAAMYTAISESAFRQRQVAARRNALMIARSELAVVGSEVPSTPGRTTGLAGGFAWEIDITPYGGDLSPSAAGPLGVVTIGVRDAHGGPNLATLRTLRVMPSVTSHG